MGTRDRNPENRNHPEKDGTSTVHQIRIWPHRTNYETPRDPASQGPIRAQIGLFNCKNTSGPNTGYHHRHV